MGIDSNHHHERCPICEQQLLGFTDADMILHIVEDHEADLDEHISFPEKETIECDNCGRQYTTHLGECPFCRNGGEPYK